LHLCNGSYENLGALVAATGWKLGHLRELLWIFLSSRDTLHLHHNDFTVIIVYTSQRFA
jgi:hypothetical protein